MGVKESFAGMNTGRGFVSLYPDLFAEEEFEALYVIKGGPGTGKSSFMRRFAEAAEREHREVELFRCGSDENSLDGVIVYGSNGKIGVIDGTLPHPYEFTLPGAVGTIIDTGAFWNRKILGGERKTISRLSDAKKNAYRTAYRYLGAAAKIKSHSYRLEKEAYLPDKALRVIRKLLEKEQSGETVHRQLSAITVNGKTRVTSDNARIISLDGTAAEAELFLGELYGACTALGIGAEYSIDPTGGVCIDSVYLPGADMLIVHAREGDGGERINLKRFFDAEKLRENRGKIRFAAKCESSLESGAFDALAEAGAAHRELEVIYGKAMDFSGLDAFARRFAKSVLAK